MTGVFFAPRRRWGATDEASRLRDNPKIQLEELCVKKESELFWLEKI